MWNGWANAGNYNLYVQVKDTWGKTYKSNTITFTLGAKPTVKSLTSITTTWRVNNDNKVDWEFNDPLGLSQSEAIIYIRNVSNTSWITYGATSNNYYIFPSGSLQNGSYVVGVEVVNTDGIKSDIKTLNITVGSVPKINITAPSSGSTWHRTRNNTISWSWSDSLGLGQKSAEIQYKSINTNTWSTLATISSASTSYTVLANAFSMGAYNFRVRARNTDDNWSEYATFNLNVGATPKVSITSPSSGGSIWRTQANTFTWNFSDVSSFVQSAYEIGYKLTSETSWTTITNNSANTFHVFSANNFKYADYNLRIRVKNDDGVWSAYAQINFKAGSTPTITITGPDNNASLFRASNNLISWTLSDTLRTGQKSYELRYRLTNSTEWIVKSATTSESSYTIPANSLAPNTYIWQVRVQNNDLNWTAWTPERRFTYGSISTLTLISPLDGENVRLLAPLTITWSSTDTLKVGQKSYELGYKLSGSEEWQTLTGTTATSRTIASGTLTHDFYNFRLKIQNNDNVWTEYTYFTLEVGSNPTLYISYPTDANIKKDIQQIFTWELVDSLNTGQYSYEMGYKLESSDEWTVLTEETERQYRSFIADTFDAGKYNWRIRITNNDGISTDYVYADFTIIGITQAPVIVSVTQSAIPTITWTVDSQDTFEFELFNNNERIYASGIQKGKGIRQFTPNIMLADGNYVIKMRCMNEFGYFTEWMTYSFILETVKPSAYNCYIFANEYHGVTVVRSLELDPVTPGTNTSTSPTPDAIYVLRRKIGEKTWNILGKLSTVDETVKFIDNEPVKNVEYEYAVRNYAEEAGYTDSESHLIKLNYKGLLIYDGNEFVNLTLSENTQFAVTHTPSKSFAYSHMIGRTYPVRESSEWMSHDTSWSCFCTFEQYEKLQKFMASNDDLWFKGNDFSFACAIDSITITAAHLNKGYDIKMSVSRINVEEVALI